MQVDLLRMNRALIVCAAQGLLLSSGLAIAAEWSIEPSVSLREEFNDNIRFTALPHSNVWMTRLSPNVAISSKTEISELSALAQINFNRYAGESGLDRNDQFFSLLGSTRSELNTWAMNASYNNDSVAETERLTTGVVQEGRPQRKAFMVNPSWTRTLSERSMFRLGYQYQDVSYDKHTSLTDYVYQQVDGTLMYQLSEQGQVNLSANYSDVNYATRDNPNRYVLPILNYFFPNGWVDSIAYNSRTLGVQAGVTLKLSETLSGSLSLGQRSTETTTTHTCNGELGTTFPTTNIVSCSGFSGDPMVTFSNKSRGNGTSFSASLDKQFSTGKMSGTLSRTTNPSGTGLVETDRVGVALSKGLTENLSGNFDASAYSTRYVDLVSPGSKYYTLEPRLSWRYSEWTTLDAGYRYARYVPDGASAALSVNAVYFNLTYNWEKFAVSR